MSFDKTKAMRDAERYLAQGKIRSAIAEYEQVIQHDPRDFGTLNILGDLYIKTSAKSRAVGCYNSVAEHYSNLGFAQKAIAVYNKISKIEPDSIEITEKLAELYKVKGSIREARSHYAKLAEHYQKAGKKLEALSIWKQIAEFDANNTDVFSNITKTHLEQGETDEAIAAYIECGGRFANQKKHELSLGCYEKALELRPDDQHALAEFVSAKFALGCPNDAVEKLSGLLAEQPTNRDILNLLIDCQIACGTIADAERSVIKLVEQEPANYPKFLELAGLYLEKNDVESTARILSMSSEHLLVGGQAGEFNSLVRDVLARDPDHLEALRLLARYCAWQRDEESFKDALVRLVRIARTEGFVEDERYALSQLTMIVPHEPAYAERLREINRELGIEENEVSESLFDERFVNRAEGEGNSAAFGSSSSFSFDAEASDFAFVDESAAANGNGKHAFEPVLETFHGVTDGDSLNGSNANGAVNSSDAATEALLEKEVDSIRFYIESGYLDLADKAIRDLRSEFGDRVEIKRLQEYLQQESGRGAAEEVAAPAAEAAKPQTAKPRKAKAEKPKPAKAQAEAPAPLGGFDLGELRDELGLEETDTSDDSDYDTHYHTAVAYQEMGLIEQSIREFQDAVGLVSPNDGTKRFFQCATLLGHCFMQQAMPKLALKWFGRALETKGLIDEEKQAVWYEVGAAHELDGDLENASKYFELVYAENVDFRDVRERVRSVMVNN